jgi:flagellar biosynthesis protein FlhG
MHRWRSIIDSKVEKPLVIAIAGGKGGVGKTVLTAAIGIALAETGHRTVVADADFGGANLHQALGIPSPPATIREFLVRAQPDINRLVLETFMPNLYLLSGAGHAVGLANITFNMKYRFIRHLNRLDADYVLLDIGAGTAFNELDYFLAAPVGVVIITPEPLAIQNGYSFVKLGLFRQLMRRFRAQPEVYEVLKNNLDLQDFHAGPTLRTLTTMIAQLGRQVVETWEEEIAAFRPQIVLNMLETRQDYEEGMALLIAANDILGLRIHHLHHVHYDEGLRLAVKEGRPEMILSRALGAAEDIRYLVQHLFFRKKYLAPAFRATVAPVNGPEAAATENRVICSVHCKLWGNCSVQQGGYPCRIKVIGYVNRSEKERQDESAA